ncbi:hypothetical protein, partial [uncultured Chryseobacterium sp.]|uniref:hypothetical protein n=1 Tax=uncultured Chryseobacterium sp. TaxID=259322 RepID=UPI0026055754
MDKLFDLLEKLINTIKSNGLFILLAILFPVLLYNFGAGSEIINDLATTERENSNLFVACSFIFLAISIWCVPTASIYLFTWLTRTGESKRIVILDRILDIYNAKPKEDNISKQIEIQVRYLAVLPWLMYIVTMGNVFHGKKFMVLLVAAIVLMIMLLNQLMRSKTDRLKLIFGRFPIWLKKFWEVITITVGVVLVFLLFQIKIEQYYDHIIIIANIFGAMYLYLFLLVKETSEDFPDDDPRKTQLIMQKTLIVHIAALVIAIGSVIYFNIQQRNGTIHAISAITVGTMLMSFFILMIEFLFTSQMLIARIMRVGLGDTRLRYTFYRYAVGATAILCIGTVFRSCNPHTFRKVSMEKQYAKDSKTYTDLIQRRPIDRYFRSWYDQRSNGGKDTVNVYLVSGQGGGSRGAAWFLLNMYELDSLNSDFYRNLFSISTVSGSTSGAQMFLASKELGVLDRVKNRKEIVKEIYRKNYLSSAFYGMLIGDYIECLTGDQDRNYYFQTEEMEAFKKAFKDQNVNADAVDDFFNMDYLSNYKRNPYRMPLFFINSTVVENGKKVVFSPVRLNTSLLERDNKRKPLFTYYEDGYGIFRNCEWSRNKGLPLSACVNASQSFPLVNAYSYLHGVGRLADGGLFENSGTSTTSEVYLALKNIIGRKENEDMKVKFTIITILNGKIDDNEAVNYKRASILNTLTAVAKNPFT